MDSTNPIPNGTNHPWNGALVSWNGDFTSQNSGAVAGTPDGYNDLIVHLPGATTLELVPGNGTGNFDWNATPITLPAPNDPTSPEYGNCPTAPASFANTSQLVVGYYSGNIGFSLTNTGGKSLPDIVVEDTTGGVHTFWMYQWDPAFGVPNCPIALDNPALAGLSLVDPGTPQQPSTINNAVYGDLWGRNSAGTLYQFTADALGDPAGTAAAGPPSTLPAVLPPGTYPNLIASAAYAGSTNPIDVWTTTPTNGVLVQLPSNQTTPTPAATITPTVLPSGIGLASGQRLESSDGAYTLVMQSDGNLVESTTAGAMVLKPLPANNPGSYVVMQGDGNLVVYSPAGKALWNSGTSGSGYQLTLSPSPGHLVITNPAGGLVWSSQPTIQNFNYGIGTTTFTAPTNMIGTKVTVKVYGAPGASTRKRERRKWQLRHRHGSDHPRGRLTIYVGDASGHGYHPGGTGSPHQVSGQPPGQHGGGSSAILSGTTLLVEAGGGAGRGR